MKLVFFLAVAAVALAVCQATGGSLFGRRRTTTLFRRRTVIIRRPSTSTSHARRRTINRRRTVIITNKKCRVYKKPVNGGSKPAVNHYVLHGATVSYYCSSGFKLVGSSTSKCNNGHIIGAVPTCQRVTCTIGKLPVNGYTSPAKGKSVSAGTKVTYTCNSGYRLSGASIRTCGNNGYLSPSVPQCIKITCTVGAAPANGGSNPSRGKTVAVGGRVTYTCNTNNGYRASGKTYATCGSNGKFSNGPPACVRVTCTVGNPPVGGSSVPPRDQKVSFGGKVTYKCGSDSRPSGSTTATCGANGRFSNGPPTCSKIECEVENGPVNGGSKPAVGGSVNLGDDVVYFCNEGFSLRGSRTAECENDGDFSNGPPSCVEIYCKVIPAPSGGSVSTSSGTVGIGKTVRYSCDFPLQLNGQSVLTCQSNGRFNYPRPSCDEVQCTVGMPPRDGSSNPGVGASVNVGETVEYECDRNFKLVGADELTCLPDGSFSDSVPRCERETTCPIPMTRSPLVSSPSSGALQVGESVSYFCDGDEYDLVGSNRANCLESGQLSASPPRCVLQTCTVSRNEMPIDGNVSPSVGATVNVGESISYSCDDGFIRDGARVAVCTSNGDFTWPPPRCIEIRVQCTVPRAPTNGQVMPDDVQKVDLNDYVSFKCDNNYKLVGSSSIQCVGNDVFDDSVPTCMEESKKKCSKPRYDERTGRFDLTPDQYSYNHGTKLVVKCMNGFVNGKNSVYTYCNDGAWNPVLRPICRYTYS